MSLGSDERPPLIAAAAMPIFPVRNGYSLRISSLVRELASTWNITLLAPLGSGSIDELMTLGPQRVVPMPMFRGWDSPLSADDKRSMREILVATVREVRPVAAIVWAGAEAVLSENEGFPPTVLDRLDSEVVIAWRDVRSASGLRARIRALRRGLVWARRERALVRHAASAIVDGRVDARVLRTLAGRASVHTVANGVVLPTVADSSGEAQHPTVVFSGSMSYSANVEAARWFAGSVWPSVRDAVPAARMIIAGRDPTPEVRALESVPGIEVTGEVPDLLAVIRSGWVAIAPVTTGSGIRTKVLEAWAQARPVVQSPVAASGLRLDADARSLVTSSAGQTARIVVRLLQDDRERHRLGASARRLVEREYGGWHGPAQRISDLLRAAMRTR